MTHNNQPVSALRQRMLDDMQLRKLSWKTQGNYIRAVKNFTRFLGRSPDTADAEDLRRFQLHMISTGVSPTLLSVLRQWWTVARQRAKMLPGVTRSIL